MPTTDEIEASGIYGPIDTPRGEATIARWKSDTYQGRAINPSTWYHLLSADGVTSLGLIQWSNGAGFAFEPVAVGQALGVPVDSINEGIRVLSTRLPLGGFSDDRKSDFEPDDAGDDDSGYGPNSYFARSMEKD